MELELLSTRDNLFRGVTYSLRSAKLKSHSSVLSALNLTAVLI